MNTKENTSESIGWTRDEEFVLDDSGRKNDYERFLRLLAERRAEHARTNTAPDPSDTPTPPTD